MNSVHSNKQIAFGLKILKQIRRLALIYQNNNIDMFFALSEHAHER